MKKFSKKSMLSFLTVSAIVVTMAGSYAVWDQLEATEVGKLTIDQPVTTSMAVTEMAAGTRTLGTENTYTGTATFTVTNPDNTPVEATISAKVIDATNADSPSDVNDFDVVIKKGDNELTGGVDSSVTDSANAYTVEVTPKDNLTLEQQQALANNSNLKVQVTGKLSAKTVTP